ncbi:hypothetical protein SacmaDRAFT_0959 [Saccharomonospora marina XMU15]|uniref:DMT(Drug/metabolite transporter) superfamily permease n=1 Tax=Saccharomonospora marina XMU15 TaxID=882083 RepID=H5XA87_9PSEU|nr:hypothetical protein [Saccharomonospora marina]EHR49252.1 hypothetical protein SacmaDRAFT_0959 [Saccharomonospora marina XMU15]
MIVAAILLATLGAAGGAVGAKLQHDGVRQETVDGGLRLGKLGRLARNPYWRRGFCVLFGAAVLQILALTFAPVSVVAPVVVLALPMVALLNAAELDVRGWLAVAATTAAIVVFVARTAGVVAERDIPPASVLTAARYVGLAVAAAAVVAALGRGTARCVSLATAAGAAYGLVVVLVRDVAYNVRVDGLDALPPASLAGLVVAFLVGSWFVQLGYASGPPDVVVGTQTLVNPAVATLIGFLLLDEATALGTAFVATLLGSGAVAFAGVVVLARHHPDAVRRRATGASLRRGT